jgi:squalene synthase HpnC
LITTPGIDPAKLRAAYAECERFTRAHETFPVASRFVPERMRSHVAALYAFARTAGDIAGQDQRPPGERLRLLDDWENRLHACVAVEECNPDDTVSLALGATIRECRLPVALFADLLSAFRQDITTHRYQTWDDLLDYCGRAANPAGRLVLRMAGVDDPRFDRSSDALCTALQLTHFWQHLDLDWARDRLYLPLEEIEAGHALVRDLHDRRMTEPWQRVLQRATLRTRKSFAAGRDVCDVGDGRLRRHLRFTWLGGMRLLERLEQVHYNVFMFRPSLGPSDAPLLVWRALNWRRG